MSNPIDIEVKDGVDGAVEKKLAGIAREARAGHKALQDLRAALQSLNTSSLAELQKVSASNTNALAREMNAQARLLAETNKGAIADARAALEKQRLATESQRTAAAEANAARAMTQSEAAALRLAQATQRAAASKSQATKDAERLDATMTRLKMSVDPLGFALDRHNAELAEARALFAAGKMGAAEFAQYESTLKGRIDATTASINAHNAALARGTVVSKHMTQAGLNLGRQFADIGVTAAMGMNPLMILIQQGPQVADAFVTAKAQGLSFTQVLRGMVPASGPLLVALGAIAAVVAVVTAGFALFHRELSKGYPDDITKGLGLTEEQLERVEHKTVTMGDTFMATLQVIGERLMNGPIGDGIRWLGEFFTDTLDFIGRWAVKILAGIYAGFVGSFKAIVQTWRRFPAVLGEFFTNAANAAIGAIEWLVNAAVDRMNGVIATVNMLPFVDIPELPRAAIGRLSDQYAGAGAEVGAVFANEFRSEYGNAIAGMADFAGDVRDAAIDRATKRALEEAGDPNKTGRGRTGRSDEEKRADALADINRELDSELKLMGMVGEQLRIETRMQGYINSLAQKGITLSEQENQALRAKVANLDHLALVQRELENIYEDFNGPLQDYEIGLEAANKLLADGRITAEQHGEAVRRLEMDYRSAVDPLYDFNKEMDDLAALAGKVGVELEVATRSQEIQNAALAKGKLLTDAQIESMERRLELSIRQRMADEELANIYAMNAGAIDVLAARTTALHTAHAQGMIGAEQYRVGLNAIAMEAANVAIRQTEMATSGQMALASLQSYMASYQGMLPGLTQSFGNFFTTVADGFANSIARSIVYAEDFGTAMQDVARQALTELIASLVKLGVQWLITQAIGNSIGTAAAGVSMAQGAAVAAAWAPAAAAVSLATLGANAVPAAAGIASTYALTQALSMIPGFKDGGMIRGPGGPRDDGILTRLSDGEFVVNAAATRQNRDLLEAINSGGTWHVPMRADGGVVSSAPAPVYRPTGGSTTNVSQGGMTVSIDMSGSNFGNADPDELEERFMRAVATQLVPPVLQQARKQANEDMTVRFVRPKI
jgi:hypothetical protein